MNYFIDTNIPLGYAIIHDKWHNVSKTFLDNHQKDSIFWSNLVKNEYTEKFNEILDDINTFIANCKTLLKENQKDFINYFDFEDFLIRKTKMNSLDNFKKQMILKQFWTAYKFSEGISEVIYLKFIGFAHEFERIYHLRDKKLNNILILHNCGLNNYLNYMDYAEKLYKWGVHKPDCKIVIDAHDCGKTHPDLIFASADKKMIDLILEHNTDFLNIAEFRSYN